MNIKNIWMRAKSGSLGLRRTYVQDVYGFAQTFIGLKLLQVAAGAAAQAGMEIEASNPRPAVDVEATRDDPEVRRLTSDLGIV
jgi:hypothetical protein